jgi:hypothetical protein
MRLFLSCRAAIRAKCCAASLSSGKNVDQHRAQAQQ